MEVIVYRLSSCGFCKNLLDLLTDNNIEHNVRQANQPENVEDCAKMDKLFESNYYPKVVLKKPNGTVFIVSNKSKVIPTVDSVKFKYYATPEDVLNVINEEK